MSKGNVWDLRGWLCAYIIEFKEPYLSHKFAISSQCCFSHEEKLHAFLLHIFFPFRFFKVEILREELRSVIKYVSSENIKWTPLLPFKYKVEASVEEKKWTVKHFPFPVHFTFYCCKHFAPTKVKSTTF